MSVLEGEERPGVYLREQPACQAANPAETTTCGSGTCRPLQKILRPRKFLHHRQTKVQGSLDRTVAVVEQRAAAMAECPT
jgi:hypothetical protein